MGSYGVISYAASLTTFLTPVAQLGFTSTLVGELVAEPSDEGEILGSATLSSLISGALCIFGIFMFTRLTLPDEPTTILVCALYSLSLLTQSIELVQYWFQAKLLSKYVAVLTLIAYAAISVYQLIVLMTGRSVVWYAVSKGMEYAIIAAGLLMIYRRLGGGRLTASISLPSISLPDNITAIGSEVFDSEMRIEAGFKTKTALALAASEIAYWDGQLQYQGTALCNCAKDVTEIVIPDGVTTILGDAINDCPDLWWITIPESVTSIGLYAFKGCTQLRQVVFLTKDSLTNIGDAGIPSEATVYCWEYYYAETWAREHGYTVRLLDDLLDENGNIDWSKEEKNFALQSDCTLERGEQRALSYGYFPTERTFGGVWNSSNPAVATVDENGVVTALQNGETVITLTEEGASATCNVRVRTTLKSFELSRGELYLPAKGTGKLSIVAMDPADSDDTFSWSISDATYATIDQEGNITAKTIGNATITVTSSSGITRTCALHITYPVTRVAFAEASAALHPGMTRTLTANVTMRTMKCVNQMVDFSSSNESVATVDEYGTVTAVGAGSATITATAQGNDTIRATCEITVTGDHEIAVDAAVPATRTREGLTEGSHCAICGEVLVAQETVPARTDLSVLSLPAATKEIEAEAFAGSAVECAAIPDGCERIGNKAFAQCAALEMAEIPASVTSIADDAFAGSERLVIVTAEGSYAQTYATNHGIPCVAE